jgi:hypothetical protein
MQSRFDLSSTNIFSRGAGVLEKIFPASSPESTAASPGKE